MVIIELKCPVHPKYKAVREPRIDMRRDRNLLCACWEIWDIVIKTQDLMVPPDMKISGADPDGTVRVESK